MKNRWRLAKLAFLGVGTLFALAALATTVPHGNQAARFTASGRAGVLQPAVENSHRTRNVIVVMVDGLRWQEVFNGADAQQLRTAIEDGLDDPEQRAQAARQDFLRPTASERRNALMPFLWTVVAQKGQMFGNRALGSQAQTSNLLGFSYPGYAETLTGWVDPRVDSNDPKPNPNATVLEWLNHKPGFAGKVAAFASWDVFRSILRSPQCGFLVNAGFDPLHIDRQSSVVEAMNTLKAEETHRWSDSASDPFPFHSAVEYMKLQKPRVLFLSLGDTDDWAHAGSYTEYLRAAHRADSYIGEFWNLLQSMPEYRNSTTLIVLPDHGRGRGAAWSDHGQQVKGSRETWMAFLGPDTPAKGERRNSAPVTESQVASTIALLLGEDYRSEVRKAAAPISDVLD